MEKEINHKWFLSHAPERVWEYLTNSELLSQWLMENDFKPVVGHEFQFKAQPRKKMGFDGNIYCRVLEVKPYDRLAYSWKGGPGNGEITLDSKVIWTLTPKDGGTELLLRHIGFKEEINTGSFIAMNHGWGSKIKDRFIELINKKEDETTKV